jgi:Co/Zn/Cd efflux system component
MRELSPRVLLVIAAVALVVAFLGAFALVTSQSGSPEAGGELQVYGGR